MLSYPSSLEIISVAQVLLNIGDEAMSGSLQINDRVLLIDRGNLIVIPPWSKARDLVPLLALNSGFVQFHEVEKLSEDLLSQPSKSLDWCVFEALRLFDREWINYQDKLPDKDTLLQVTNEFRGTIELNRVEQSIYDVLEKNNSTSVELSKKLGLDLEELRLVVYCLSIIGLIEEIHQLETITSIRQAKKPNYAISALPKPVVNQLRVGLPIVSLVFLWLFNILGGTELKLLGVLQRLTTYEESLDNIVLVELDKSQTDIAEIVETINQVDPALVGLVSDRVPPDSVTSEIDYIGLVNNEGYEFTTDNKILDATRIIDDDGVERRGVVGRTIAQSFQYSFGGKLALERLKQFNITPQWHDTKAEFSLSRTDIHPLSHGNSLYPRQSLDGYQVLLNPIYELETVSFKKLRELEEDSELNNLLDNKIVILGYKHLSSTESLLLSDLQLQANIANQILLSATYNRRFINVTSRWYSIGFSFLIWAIVLQISLKIRKSENRQLQFAILLLSIVTGYSSFILLSFSNGMWLGFSYPLLATLLGILSAFGYQPTIANSYIDAESSLLSNKGFYNTTRKLLNIQFNKVESSILYIISVENFKHLTKAKDAKSLIDLIVENITKIVENLEQANNFTIGRLNTNRFGLLIPNLSFETSKQLKKTFSDAFFNLNQQFKGSVPIISIGMSLSDGKNYVSPIQLVASADSDSLSLAECK
jgi:hypothetical protein